VASRVLLPLVTFEGNDDRTLYEAMRRFRWTEHFDPSNTFVIGSSQARSSSLPAHYWVQRAKDAIVDAFRDETGVRPSIDKRSPDLRFHLHVGAGVHELSLDFSGEALHRRGYRKAGGKAPLKENLAAAILYLAGWPDAASAGRSLVDPTCGTGTFLTEAALIATRTAPGLLRESFGFEKWRWHDPSRYEEERRKALSAQIAESPARIYGFDASSRAIAQARRNLLAAEMSDYVSLTCRSLDRIDKPSENGMIVCNPPYGHRLGDDDTLFLFYQALGDVLKNRFAGWTAFVFAAKQGDLKYLGLKPSRRHVLFNGAIECRLVEIPIAASPTSSATKPAWRKPTEKAEMFANRIKKNRKKRERWASRHGLECYRLYDADIPEYNVAVDRYQSKAVVQVYQRPNEQDSDLAKQRIQDVLITLPTALGITSDDLVVKVRRRHEQGDQYARLAQREAELVVAEGDVRFFVNLEDRIDTGLFLDHRKVRAYARERCTGLRMLNLFAYTCAVSVAAAVGGARETTNVDLSNTYLDWGRRNYVLNRLDPTGHRFIRGDAQRWVAGNRRPYDWIFINPPTFSRSKKTKGAFNVHQHHARLIEGAMHACTSGGELLFTTHARDFVLDRTLAAHFEIEECAQRFVPEDFARSPFSAFFVRPKRASAP
jgi:23S rRNA (guanine2445-N2)-methyltransferase / 23S rRNA (guanine2069-N7)-methyltransferase